jgi:hypothetical protein
VQKTTFGRHAAQHAQKLVPVDVRHAPIEQHGIGHVLAASVKSLLAVFRLCDLKPQAFENSPRHLANDSRIINDQAIFHHILAACLKARPAGHQPEPGKVVAVCCNSV